MTAQTLIQLGNVNDETRAAIRDHHETAQRIRAAAQLLSKELHHTQQH